MPHCDADLQFINPCIFLTDLRAALGLSAAYGPAEQLRPRVCRYGLVDSDDEDAAAGGAGPRNDQRPASMGDEAGEPEGEGMLLSASPSWSSCQMDCMSET